jgi:hypothetical protein
VGLTSVPVSSGAEHRFGNQITPHPGGDIDENPVIVGSVETAQADDFPQASIERVAGMIDQNQISEFHDASLRNHTNT